MNKNSSTAVLVLYTMSGFTGLLAEQGIEKYTGLLVGVTASAAAVVVFTYFLGFAIGGFVAARLLRRGSLRRSLQAYGLVELSVGIACAVFTYAFHPAMEALAPLQSIVAGTLARQAVRFACGCVLILPIAALMGASFPLIAQVLDNNAGSGPRRWSVAYTFNLAGAVLAAVLAPYFILPHIGLRGGMWLCFAICASIAAAAQFLSGGSAVPAAVGAGPATRARLDRSASLLLVISFVSGLAFFALEVIWTHLIGTVIGGSVYAFSSMLAAVLIGLWIGAACVNWADKEERLPIWVLLALCAGALLLQLKTWDLVCVLFVIPGPAIYRGFYSRELYRLLIALLVIVPPAAVLGMIYPRVLRGPRGNRDEGAWLAGYLSASNSLGCLLGALGATFLFVPYFGSENSLKGMILVFAVMALIFLAGETSQARTVRLTAAGVIAIVILSAVTTHWDWFRLTSGAAVYFGEFARGAGGTGALARSRLIFRDEHIQGGFTTVVDTTPVDRISGASIRSLYSDGKLQANDDPDGEFKRLNFGMVFAPALFVGNFDRALLIGLGSGQSAWMLKQAGFQGVDIAEFSPGIVNAAAVDFTHINHQVLADRTVRVILEDGRNLLLVESRKKYSLITVLLSTIWYSGATNLYSKEFYELARKRLDSDGILLQWVPLHRIGPDAISSAIATARAVFPAVAYWDYGGQGMLLAGNHPLVIHPERKTRLAEWLSKSSELPPGRAGQILDDMTHAELLSSAGVEAMIASRKPVINTDHNRYIEYDTPRYSSSERDWRAYNIAYFRAWNR
jgi:spermidine synthase